MKKLLPLLFAACFGQQASAASTVAGIDFIDIADVLDASVGSFTSNSMNGTSSIVDGNAASYILSNDTPASVDVSFGGDVFDVSEVDLTVLFVGDGGHAGTITLLGGSSAGSFASFSIADGENYTGYNSKQGETLYGLYAATIDLSGFSGTFSGVSLDISGASALPSLLGTTAPVPIPGAVWLFGSGLLGLAGLARRQRVA